MRYVYAQALKHPYVVEDEETGEVRREIIYVTNGRAVRVAATPTTLERVLGRALLTKPHTGLWRDNFSHFLVSIAGTGASAQAVGVDRFPDRLYGNTLKHVPVYRLQQESIVIVVNKKTGDLDFKAVPPQRIPNTDTLKKLIKAIHAVPSISPGDTFIGKYEVQDVTGNKVELDLIGDTEE